MIDEVIIVEFLNSRSVAFQWPDNISDCVICGILVCEVEFFCNLFTLPDVNWPVEDSSDNLNLLFSSDLRFIMSLGLFNMFFLDNWLRLRLRHWLFINFTDNSDALNW